MFIDLGYVGLTCRHDNDHDILKMLNYAYAVLDAICHRSIVAYGMSPFFGVHHTANFHNHPLVYDLIKSFRPFIDKQLLLFIKIWGCQYRSKKLVEFFQKLLADDHPPQSTTFAIIRCRGCCCAKDGPSLSNKRCLSVMAARSAI